MSGAGTCRRPRFCWPPDLKVVARGPSRLAGAMRSLISYPRQEAHNDPVAVPVNGNLYGSVVRIAADCYPLPGDQIVGIVTMGEGVVVYPVGARARPV